MEVAIGEIAYYAVFRAFLCGFMHNGQAVSGVSVFRSERNERDEHLFERYSAMLESAGVILGVIIEIIGITEEILPCAEDVGRGDIRRRKAKGLRVGHCINILRLADECLAHLVSEVGIGVFVGRNGDGAAYADGSMIGSEYHLVAQGGKATEEFAGGRMAEPRLGKGTVSGFIGTKFAHHFRLCAAM